MSGFGCWIQPRFATILTFLPAFDSTAASILAKLDLSSWKTAEQFGIHRSTLYRHLNARQKRSA